jgi:peptidoglycan/xylan/chitin deacetylase (PgdA/CDA1 family)
LLRLDRQIMKKWMQGIGLIYILLLLGVCVPGVAGGNAQNDIGETLYLIRSENPKKGTDRKTEQPKIALTFDDGPNAQFTPLLLDGLKKRGVKATFFLIGKNIEAGNNADIVKREWEEGHLLGNHTYNHVEITRVSNDTAYQEIKATNDLISEITGAPVEYMRPPFGLWQKKLEQRIHVLPVMWTVDPLDWATENEDEIVNKVVTEVEENDIILLHDCYKSSVRAALRIVDLLEAEGYQFVTVDELLVE